MVSDGLDDGKRRAYQCQSTLRGDKVISLESIIKKSADDHKVPVNVIEGIIFQESYSCSTKPQYAWRLEEKFFKDRLADKGANELAGLVPSTDHAFRLPSLYDEKIARACSYGYMQILGETARSILGFRGQFLTELFDPEVNIDLGCRLLAKNLRAFQSLSSEERLFSALTRYNGSRTYPPLILGHIASGRHLRIYS